SLYSGSTWQIMTGVFTLPPIFFRGPYCALSAASRTEELVVPMPGVRLWAERPIQKAHCAIMNAHDRRLKSRRIGWLRRISILDVAQGIRAGQKGRREIGGLCLL